MSFLDRPAYYPHFVEYMRVPPHSARLPKASYAALLSLFTSLMEENWALPTQRYLIDFKTLLGMVSF